MGPVWFSLGLRGSKSEAWRFKDFKGVASQQRTVKVWETVFEDL